MTYPLSSETSPQRDAVPVSARVVDAFVETSNPKKEFTIDSQYMNDLINKISSPGNEVSRTDDVGDSTTTREQKMQGQQVPLKGSQPHPRSALRQLSPSLAASSSASFAAASKFSYEPRPSERAYYHGLFNYVASFLDHGNNVGKAKEIILPPKLVANKLFLASNLPSDRLRLIWNMATAIASSDTGGASSGCATEGAVAAASQFPEEDKKTDVTLMSNAAGNQLSRSSNKTGKSRTSSSILVMTQAQFNTAIRLIQLFQNRSAASDQELKKVEKSKLPKGENTHGVGAIMQGTLVPFDEDGLLPPFFEGVSGVVVAMPGTKEYKSNGYSSMMEKKVKHGLPFRRRSMDDGMDGANIASTRRLTVNAQMRANVINEQRMKQVEQEVIFLKHNIRSLEIEVGHLKAMLTKGAVNRRVSVASSTDSKRGKDSTNRLSDVLVTGRFANQDLTSKAVGKQNYIHDSDSFYPREEAKHEDEPNIGVESFWGKKDQFDDSVCLPHSMQIKRAKARLAVKEVASFDPAVKNDIGPPNVSSNIPAVHPSAKHHSILVRQKKQVPQPQAPSHTQSIAFEPNSLQLSQSSAGSNSTGSRKGKLASFTPNINETSAGNNSKKEGMGDASLPSNVLNNARTSRIFQPNRAANGPASRTRHDPTQASVYSEQTTLVSNGYSNHRSSRTTPLHATTSAPVQSSTDPSPKFPNTTRASIQHSHNAQKFSSARPPSRLTRDSLAQSVRHIVRTKDGTTQVYSEKDDPPSTKALDLKPLEPAPLAASGILRN